MMLHFLPAVNILRLKDNLGPDVIINESDETGRNGPEDFGGIVDVHFGQEFGKLCIGTQTFGAKHANHFAIALCARN